MNPSTPERELPSDFSDIDFIDFNEAAKNGDSETFSFLMRGKSSLQLFSACSTVFTSAVEGGSSEILMLVSPWVTDTEIFDGLRNCLGNDRPFRMFEAVLGIHSGESNLPVDVMIRAVANEDTRFTKALLPLCDTNETIFRMPPESVERFVSIVAEAEKERMHDKFLPKDASNPRNRHSI